MTGIDLSYAPATRHATVVTVISAPRFFLRRRRVLLIFELSFSGRKSKSEYNATGPKTPKTTQTVILTYDHPSFQAKRQGGLDAQNLGKIGQSCTIQSKTRICGASRPEGPDELSRGGCVRAARNEPTSSCRPLAGMLGPVGGGGHALDSLRISAENREKCHSDCEKLPGVGRMRMRGSIVESATYGEDGKFDCIIIEDNDEKRMSERKRSVYRGRKDCSWGWRVDYNLKFLIEKQELKRCRFDGMEYLGQDATASRPDLINYQIYNTRLDGMLSYIDDKFYVPLFHVKYYNNCKKYILIVTGVLALAGSPGGFVAPAAEPEKSLRTASGPERACTGGRSCHTANRVAPHPHRRRIRNRSTTRATTVFAKGFFQLNSAEMVDAHLGKKYKLATSENFDEFMKALGSICYLAHLPLPRYHFLRRYRSKLNTALQSKAAFVHLNCIV
ncbi:hypothetical protein GEV33_010107 [Tenebrio molitor]|uniref:Cytosolic fatty-acid binding proteins domain-containing protein n=1 Tax=Tenebrio molitor TaxID=7067 RepID=A0A8J6HDT7_TENMO|nr:hypothetical protein GEV33_010107 [Tenebrio molitor]